MTPDATALARREAVRQSDVSRYARMFEIRAFEEQVNRLFAEGRIHGTTHLCQGQEALAVGLASILRPTDIVTATYRGHGVALALGMTTESVLAEIMGRSQGCTRGVGGSMHLCDLSVGLLPTFAIIGAGLPVAVGAAVAFQTRAEDRVAVAVFGDGASNIGAFHEALNLAAVWRLPVVFLLDNNVYGEYSRIDSTTAITDLHQRAASYGMPGMQVDGMDLEAVRTTLDTAIAQARSGSGPVLVEAKTYRFAGHSRADAAAYRPEGELEQWSQRDPVHLMRNWLLRSGYPDHVVAEVEHQVVRDLERVIQTVSASEGPALAVMFENNFEGQG